mgnify:FL=1
MLFRLIVLTPSLLMRCANINDNALPISGITKICAPSNLYYSVTAAAQFGVNRDDIPAAPPHPAPVAPLADQRG